MSGRESPAVELGQAGNPRDATSIAFLLNQSGVRVTGSGLTISVAVEDIPRALYLINGSWIAFRQELLELSRFHNRQTAEAACRELEGSGFIPHLYHPLDAAPGILA